MTGPAGHFLCYSFGSVSPVFAFFRFRENFFPPPLRRAIRTITTITAAITSSQNQLYASHTAKSSSALPTDFRPLTKDWPSRPPKVVTASSCPDSL